MIAGAPLLLVDDDETYCEVLAAALSKRGFAVTIAHNIGDAMVSAARTPPKFAVVDLRMPGESGLDVVARLYALEPSMRIVVLTGYSSIATAVEAIKLGATHYLTKPADADDVVAAFQREHGDAKTPVPDEPISVDRLEWEHIQRVLADCDGNITLAARHLGMHRRTLQRKLYKKPVKR